MFFISISQVLLCFFIKCCFLVNLATSCVSFVCLNSCGLTKQASGERQGFKLILANNRDADLRKPAASVNVWQPQISAKKLQFLKNDTDSFEQYSNRKLKSTYNLCSFGPLSLGDANKALSEPSND